MDPLLPPPSQDKLKKQSSASQNQVSKFSNWLGTWTTAAWKPEKAGNIWFQLLLLLQKDGECWRLDSVCQGRLRQLLLFLVSQKSQTRIYTCVLNYNRRKAQIPLLISFSLRRNSNASSRKRASCARVARARVHAKSAITIPASMTFFNSTEVRSLLLIISNQIFKKMLNRQTYKERDLSSRTPLLRRWYWTYTIWTALPL